jgi:predicted ATPase
LQRSGDIDSGYKFGQLALNLLEIYQAKEIKTKVYFLFNHFVRHWKEHIINVVVSSSEEFKNGLETGDIEYTCYCAFDYCNSLFWAGENLEVTITYQVKYINTMLNFKQYLISDQTKILNQVAVNLVKISATPCKLAGESFDEEKMLPNLKATNSTTVISQIYLAKLILSCFFRNYNEAIKNAQIWKSIKIILLV